MEHFPPEDWVDLARSLLPQAKVPPMQAHLEKGCEECQEAWAVWRLILDLSSREASYRPAEGVVRTVKAAYTGHQPWKWLTRIAQFAQLTFDSFLQPSPAMIRASGSKSRQLVHQAEPYVIDIRLDSDPLLGKHTFLTGQILNSERPEESSGLIDIVLLSGDKLLGKTVASTSGEFELELGREENIQLFINIRGQRAIGIALPELEAER